jgi:valyl-tRNA synthetase
MIDKYGADALRFTLLTGNAPGNDMRFSDEKIEASRNFCNKIWNSARFTLMNLSIDKIELPASEKLGLADKWVLTLANKLAKEVCENLDKFELGIALAKIYEFIWDTFCDWYIELVKPRLADKDSEDGKVAQNVLAYVLASCMQLLHPFMPFITEEIWQSLPTDCESIMISRFPEYDEKLDFADSCKAMERIIAAIKSIRNVRRDMDVPPSKKAALYIESSYADSFNESTAVYFTKLASASEVHFVSGYDAADSVQAVSAGARCYIPLAEMIDTEKELARLEKEKAKAESEVALVERKLSNESFVAKAPAAVVEGEKAKLAKHKETLANILESIEKLKK